MPITAHFTRLALRVDFSAWNSKGKLVDGSQQRGGPETYAVTGVIAGWARPSRKAGSPRGLLVYEVELLKIVP